VAIGSVPSLIVGIGAGAAAADGFAPSLERPKQDAWASQPNRIVDVGTLARLVAQGGVDLGTAQPFAHRNGYSNQQLNALVYLAQTVPGIAQTMFLWRLNVVKDAEFRQALVKGGMRQDWVNWIVDNLRSVPLTAEQVAVAVQRSLIPNEGQLPFDESKAAQSVNDLWNSLANPQLGHNPGSDTPIQAMPVTNLKAYESAAAYGVSNEQLDVLTRTIGLPIAPQQAAALLYRRHISADTFARALAEGNTRIEWASAYFEAFRQILTAHDAAELQLRGYLTRDERLAKTLNHGMSEAESDLLYDLLGRSVNVHQVLIGERRGGKYMPAPATFDEQKAGIPDAYLAALERGNLRPEYYQLAYAARETYPSYFVTRALLQANVISATRGSELFAGLGWPEDVTKAAADYYSGGTGTTADTHLTKAQNQLWTATHRGYLTSKITDAEASTALTTAGVATATIPQVLAIWQEERSLDRKTLTAAQAKKAWAILRRVRRGHATKHWPT
jgi:hypothetical protein